MFLGVCAEFDFAVFVKINSGPYHKRPCRDRAGHADVYWERVEPKKFVFYHAGYHSVWGFFCRVTSSMYFRLVSLTF